MSNYMRTCLGLLLFGAVASPSFAVGGANIGNEVPSARSAGQGYVGVAGQNDDPTAVYTNPAAMTKLDGTHLSLGGTWENIHGSYDSPDGDETKMRVQNPVIPNASLTQSFWDGTFAAGLGIQSPDGLETHWPGNSPLRYVATDSRLREVTIMPAVAVKIHRTLSFGIGADYTNLFDAQLDHAVSVDAINASFASLGVGNFTSGSPDGVSSIKGSGIGWGFHSGLLYEPTPQHSLGVTFHSMQKIQINGTLKVSGLSGQAASAFGFGGSDYETSAYTDIALPANVQMGYAFKPNDRWMFEADSTWIHWSELRDLNVRFPDASGFAATALAQGNPATLNLRDAWSFASGVNFKASDTWQFRTGFWYEPWAMPETYFSPAFLDLSRYGATIGVGHTLTTNLSFDLAYNAIFFHTRSISNNVGTTTSGVPATGIPTIASSPDISGTYKNFSNLVAFNLNYKFGLHSAIK